MPKETKQAWDRWFNQGEGQDAYELLLVYISLGKDRSPKLVAEKAECELNLVQGLCTKFHWVRRAKAYDNHLIKIKEQAIENQTRINGLIFAERYIEYQHEAYALSEEILNKARQMLRTPLYQEEHEVMRPITVGDQTVEVPTKIIIKPVKWSFKDMVALGEFSDKLRRLAMGVPTSRTAVTIVPAETLEERIAQARAAMDFWEKNKLPRAIERIIEADPSQDEDEVRQQLLDEAPGWFCDDFKVPDPKLLTEGTEPPPLDIEEDRVQETEGIN